MTLQNGAIIGSKAHMWCDTAFMDAATGKTVFYDTKAFQGLFWPFAGTTTTIGGNPHQLMRNIGNAYPKDHDELVEITRRQVIGYAAGGHLVRVLLATCNPSPRLVMVASDDLGFAKPFEPVEMTAYTSSGNQSAAYQLAIANGWTRARMLSVIEHSTPNPTARRMESFTGTSSVAGAWN
jgi:hypothetical protein